MVSTPLHWHYRGYDGAVHPLNEAQNSVQKSEATTENEPVLGGEHPLLKLDNALCTPHSAWIEQDTYELYFGEAFAQVIAFAAGEPVNVVNPEALERR